jgi:hypothetical protein
MIRYVPDGWRETWKFWWCELRGLDHPREARRGGRFGAPALHISNEFHTSKQSLLSSGLVLPYKINIDY